MSKFSQFLEEKVLPLSSKISSQRYLKAISSSFMTLIPFLTIGSLALVLISPPVASSTLEPGLMKSFISGWEALAAALKTPVGVINSMCMDFMSVYVAAGMGFFLSRYYKMKGFLPIILTTVTFMMLSVTSADGTKIFDYFGGQGLFTAIISSIASFELLRFLLNKRVGYISLEGQGVPEAITESFAMLIPAAITLVVFGIIHAVVVSLTGNIFPALIGIVMTPIMAAATSLPGLILIAFIVMTFWWFGIHDTCTYGLVKPFFLTTLAANMAAYAAGETIPYIATNSYWFMFLMIGGSGATFGLCLVLLFLTKSKQLKTVGKLGIIPAFFNINEPVVFGVPLMLNPLMYIPFVGAVVVNLIVSFVSMDIGLVAKTVAEPGWNMFCPIGALIATVDIKAMLLVIVLIVLDALIYFPFVKIYDKQKLAEESETANEVS